MTTDKEQQELNDRLFDAVAAKDADAVEALLDAGADANARRVKEPRLLDTAVKAGDARIVALLAPRTLYLDVSDDCNFTALTHAVRHNKADVAHALLDAGASPFPHGDGAEYPLDWAVGNKMYSVIGRMLEKWPDRLYKDEPLLIYAVKTDDMELAKTVVAAGANVNRGTARNGYTALHMAARKNSGPFIGFLLDQGASLEAKANGTQTVFDWSSDDGKLLRRIVAERQMKETARAMTEGAPENITVRQPVRFKKSPTF
jgi:ankyrin repeat protein